VDAEATMWMMRRLYELTKPTIAAVNGPAIAGGTGLATLCDFTLAAPPGRFGYTEVRIGFHSRHRLRISARDGLEKRRPRACFLSAGSWTPKRPMTQGLVTELVAEGQLMARVRRTRGALAQEQPGVHERGQETAVLVCQGAPRSRLARAMRWNEKIRNSADFREGLSAFLEKRDPVWPGRKLR